MKLKCIGYRSPRFNNLVVSLGAGKSLKFYIGDEHEVDDKTGHEILSRPLMSKCLVMVADAKPAPKPAANKMPASDKRK